MEKRVEYDEEAECEQFQVQDDPGDEDMLVEDYLTKHCDKQTKRIMDHAETLIATLRKTSEEKKKELRELLNV
jgi:hypothetical protein